jgi:hypothetical protein
MISCILVAFALVFASSLIGFAQQPRSSKRSKPQPQRQKQLPAKTPDVKQFVIPLDLPNDEPQTETRALVSFVNDNPSLLLLRMELPFYRVESGPMGLMGSPSLAWAPGAEHVYSGRSESVSRSRSSFGKHPRILPNGWMIMIAEQGTTFEGNKLSGWEIESDPAYPLTFKVVKDVGYVYMYGRGEVRSPTGQAQKLGQTDTVDKWIRKLTDTDPLIREAAAQALGWLGNSTAVPALCKALGDPIPLVRRSAAESLGRIGHASALEALQAVAEDEHAWTAETVKWALEKVGASKNKD